MKIKNNSIIRVVLLGGKGTIGSGLRKFLPKINPNYRFTIVDNEQSIDKSDVVNSNEVFINLDISNEEEKLSEVLLNKDLIIYLARKDPLNEMNKMTDLVFKTVEKFNPNALIIGSSSVHATGGAYFPFLKEPYKTIASREFNKLETWPELLNANIEPCPTGDYGLEKAYVESWCQRFAVTNMNAIAARWGGINIDNKMIDEVAYFTVWCHQEDSAKFVDNCYKTFVDGKLRSGAHYYVISKNKYSIFDIETPKKEIGYNPIHDAEIFY